MTTGAILKASPHQMKVSMQNATHAPGQVRGFLECGAPESLLRAIFGELAAAGVAYCVMRNFDQLPHSVGTSDLDILVLPEHLELAEQAIRNALAGNAGCIVARVVARSRYLKTMGKSAGHWWGLAIDLVADVDFLGMVYTQASAIIKHAGEERGVMVANKFDAAVMGLVKELINNLKADTSYCDDARDAIITSGATQLRGLDGFDEPVRARFVACLQAKAADPVELEKIGLAMRADLRQRNRANLLKIACSEIYHRFMRVWHRPGSVVVVTGTDGSGKSTLLGRIIPVLERAFHKRVHQEHLRPNWLPAIGLALGTREALPHEPACDPHCVAPDGFWRSLLRLGYYYLDYTVGYYRKIFPLLVSRCHLVCFDRYFHDVMMDPRRMRIGLPLWMMRLVFALVPAPDLVLCLGGDPGAIYRRKPETSEAEVIRQVNSLRFYCESHHDVAVWIDTTVGPAESADMALEAIMDKLGKRN